MEFKKEPLKLILLASLLSIVLMGLMIWEFFPKADQSVAENVDTISPIKEEPAPAIAKEPVLDNSKEDDVIIQNQLDRDRQQQKQTKYLKTKLEQTNLELEEEKSLSEINRLKKENAGVFNEPAVDGPKNMPEIKVEYIGGDSVKKEAILSIAGANYQVKEKSNPMDNIQVVSISDSSVTLHFSTPEELTKTFNYKPE